MLAVSPLALQFSRSASESTPTGALWTVGFYFLFIIIFKPLQPFRMGLFFDQSGQQGKGLLAVAPDTYGRFEILVPSRKHVAFIDGRKAALAGEAGTVEDDDEGQKTT